MTTIKPVKYPRWILNKIQARLLLLITSFDTFATESVHTNQSGDSFYLYISIGLLIFLTVYYLIVWLLRGIDPPKDSIIPKYYPPKGMSPAAMRFIWNRSFDYKCLAIVIINLAIKKYINIRRLNPGEYNLTKLQNTDLDQMSRGERQIYSYLFDYRKSYTITGEYNPDMGVASKVLSRSLRNEFNETSFKKNRKYRIYGGIISIISFIACWIHFFTPSLMSAPIIILPVIIIVFSIALYIYPLKPFLYYSLLILAITTLISFLSLSSGLINLTYIIIFIYITIINLIFGYLVQSPTSEGSKLIEQIECFKLFLQTAEKDRIEISDSPKLTSDLFEKYLPYAIALGIENDWSKTFNQIMLHQHGGVNNYHQDWFLGVDFLSHDFESTINSLSTDLANTVENCSIDNIDIDNDMT